MKSGFASSLFGYDKKQVDEFLKTQSTSYEEQQEQLSAQKERILELNNHMREMREQTEQVQRQLDEYRNKELAIAQTMIYSAEKARMIESEGLEHRRLMDEEVETRHAEYHQYVADKWSLISTFENAMQQMVEECAVRLERLKASAMFTDLPRLGDIAAEPEIAYAEPAAAYEESTPVYTEAVAEPAPEPVPEPAPVPEAPAVFEQEAQPVQYEAPQPVMETAPVEAPVAAVYQDVSEAEAQAEDDDETPIWNRIMQEAANSEHINTQGLVE